ncbi:MULTISPECIES: rolling circle replication-associated protein [Lactobacillus]|jgi:putative replicative protein|uniref:Replicative protein n=1 Tax=Lactobacillus mulieris TaxID=2508708 RepID=A0AAP3GW95_9LACO|nr:MULTISPECIES: replicative protein [Lactobacillus]MCF1851371.1 replicative protein [Lactobacillus jensenii]MCT7752693.1 replicative protein [Lactobacillus iners]MCT7778065.1 replicative protein [Lactobacillus iners]MCT7785838.1 replicative protein [Lactobacillus iners]MCT7865698.1 replicative protein [Lactobacillus iners]
MKKTKRSINEYDEVKAYFYGSTIELTNGIGPKEPKTKVIKGHRYVVLETGEIKNMNRESEKRTDNLDSVRRTMKGLRRLIVANFVSNEINRKDQLWITLTYREDVNATDKNSPEVVYKDFKRFIRKLREKYNPTIEYIAVLEPQASGRWHLHVLMKTLDHSKLYIPNSNIENLWGKGFTSTKRLKNSDNVSAYVMAYVSNVEIDLKSSDKDKANSKKVIKGGRLSFYPKGIRIYRRSRNLVDPEIQKGQKREVLTLESRKKLYKPKVYIRNFKNKYGKQIKIKTEFYTKKGKDLWKR